MSKEIEPKSNTPLLIIVAVLVAAALGAWYLYGSSKPTPTASKNTASSPSSTPKQATIPANAPAGANPPNQAGSPTATVRLEEFADFQCPTCAAAHPTMNEIKSIYGSRIHFIFRDYPLAIPQHDKSYEAAVSAEAAGMQGKFWDMQNLLFTNQRAWTADPTYKEIWKGYAQKIGLDIDKWQNDMSGIAAKSRVDADMARGRALGVNSTPTLYINDSPVDFSDMNVEKLRMIIDAELKKATPQKDAQANTATANSNK